MACAIAQQNRYGASALVVGDGNVLVAIAIEIAYHHRGWKSATGVCCGRAEMACAVAQQNRNLIEAVSCNSKVLLAISIEIAHRDGNRLVASTIYYGSAETAHAVAQQNRYGAWTGKIG